MKKILYIIVFGAGLISCNNEDTYESIENNPPTIPVQIYPSDNLLCIDNKVTFEWEAASDPDGNELTYDVEIAKDRAFTEIEEVSEYIQGTSVTISLEKGIAYYWRIRAVDSYTFAGEYSAVNQFYVEGEGLSNYLPFAPLLVSPKMDVNITGDETTLQWNANDLDDENLMYDVYLATVNPPTTPIAENVMETSMTTSLESGVKYYWKVVVKDEKGGQTVGQVWSFSTE
ncbi:hypothetical protein HX109_11835 [Galbibacter sp. BG1]|uniref:hypothetical protein n=1 Tax=Galbibacter sp. BG1 TaxID=1170699 RepID=UPI0015BD74A2|nr:hypothetical protein [Galbibacter sp. BG1]QLE02213.1 hypothetical protein HX109_11835 [Galbibacter sp. BG1]